jgi:hypothetical protein
MPFACPLPLAAPFEAARALSLGLRLGKPFAPFVS